MANAVFVMEEGNHPCCYGLVRRCLLMWLISVSASATLSVPSCGLGSSIPMRGASLKEYREKIYFGETIPIRQARLPGEFHRATG